MQKNRRLLIKKLIRVISSIGRIVEYRIGKTSIGFYRDQVIFGKLHEESFYLLNADRDLVEIDHKLFNQEQQLRRKVSKAYDMAR